MTKGNNLNQYALALENYYQNLMKKIVVFCLSSLLYKV